MRKLPPFAALQAFEAAARLGGLAYAAKELRRSPSAISHQVKSLERHFGRTLFVRGHRQVTLTEDGHRLQARLTDALDTIEAACAVLSPEPRAETLCVHCTPSFASKWLAPRLPSFIQRAPDIRLQFTSSAEPIDLLRRDDLDMIIAYGSAPTQTGIEVVPLGRERIAVLCTPALAATLDGPREAGWRDINLIESVLSPVKWEDWFARAQVWHPALHSRSAFDRGALAIAAAAQGLGVALETTRFAETELADGALVEAAQDDLPGVERALHFLCYRESDRAQRSIRAFRSWLLREARVTK